MTVQSVDRAISLLEVVARQSCGAADAARATGLPLTTAVRLLETLEERGVVSRHQDGTYLIGPLLREVAGGPRPAASIQAVAADDLAQVATELNEAACLSVPVGRQMLTLTQIDHPRPVKAQDWTGQRWDITAGGSGTVLLATWPQGRVETVLKPLSDAQQRKARRAINDARRSGVVWTVDAYVDGLTSVSAPVLDDSGIGIASVIAYGPSYRYPEPRRKRATETIVANAARSISRKLAI